MMRHLHVKKQYSVRTKWIASRSSGEIKDEGPSLHLNKYPLWGLLGNSSRASFLKVMLVLLFCLFVSIFCELLADKRRQEWDNSHPDLYS